MRGGRVLGAVTVAAVLAVSGCGTEPTPGPDVSPDAAAPAGALVAIPTDGSEPSTALDIGGPDLEQRCLDSELPLPVDLVGSLACEIAPEMSDSDLDRIQGSIWSGVTLEPGTYWVVLVCSGPGGYSFGSATPDLSAGMTVECDPEGRAVRQELGTLTKESVVTVSGGPTAGDVTYMKWLIREGKTAL